MDFLELNNSNLGFTKSLKPFQKCKVESALNTLYRMHIKDNSYILKGKDFIIYRMFQCGYATYINENEQHYKRDGTLTKPKNIYGIGNNEGYIKTTKTLYKFALYLKKNFKTIEDIKIYLKQEQEEKIKEQQEEKEKKLKEQQVLEKNKNKENQFKSWLDNQILNFKDNGKLELAKDMFLNESNSYNESYLKKLIILTLNIDNPKCKEALKRVLWNGNKTSKKVFYCLTGIKLPLTDKGTYTILNNVSSKDYKGIQEYKKRQQHNKDMRSYYKLVRDKQDINKTSFKLSKGEYLKWQGLDLFIEKCGGVYSITEGKTGVLLIGSEKTRKKLKGELKNLKSHLEEIKKQINNSINSYGLSPLYKVDELKEQEG
ncbi:hypothetical protein BJV85_002844 [Clostridium acetobutylicum]|uniref:Uncharacterized protein n=1 Tax=Clostridium acetobutylicum (strain ATCC 824 / DSM 792 / JCM 1419 / IAM 19013 / LMG 5710 / NBRC 13948 / NRRL B-527 / VKM B-1787 / 2291 / W) TaxID=272562 RepID=Q97JW8_CLOAB|nr:MULTISPECIES: hypothetical protein [Clostridium]AAK79127.1 Hypothetical protein CA_C1155 [Clostridium acetobutylicum ATCC 824]ADZ20205.1 Conserved hypothetical protein [Clostridium acetobutylicum EA 2018]AEI31663.1 hypothetical protein SMB_G1175 [Clostridium acetobutylicum DSM 1731]AWV81620.1 hypothetical protein DK921_16280 [Clostridium acetobutylicum]MBC2393263.1 hypothetical protein [Clostridium acetobutylicum]